MRLARSFASFALILTITLLLPHLYFSQSRQTRRIRPGQPANLAATISELLKLTPLPPDCSEVSAADKFSGTGTGAEKERPPADDAPIEELIRYWSRFSYPENGSNSPKPSEKVRYRILEACEDRPWRLSSLINLLPDTPDAHDRLYKVLNEESDREVGWKLIVQRWLMHHSHYFRDDLIASARSLNDSGSEGADDLEALSRLDWELAKPLLESLAAAGKPYLTPVALSWLYRHSVESSDATLAENYRARLKEIVMNGQALVESRRIAIESLMSTEWSGQEEWFISLFNDTFLSGMAASEESGDSEGKKERDSLRNEFRVTDETLRRQERQARNSDYSNLLSFVLHQKPDKWIPVFTSLIGNNDRSVHDAAVSCLTAFVVNEANEKQSRKEVARQLLPWLTQANWSSASGRSALINMLGNLELPESVEGLIWILDHDESDDNRAASASALRNYRDPRSVSGLRRTLERENSEQFREEIVNALALCGGFSDEEMAAAIEAFASMTVTSGGEKLINDVTYGDYAKALPLKVSIGRILAGRLMDDSETKYATEGMASLLFDRVDALRTSRPDVAKQILNIIRRVPLHIAYLKLIERISSGSADVDDLTVALETRDLLQKSVDSELRALFKQGGYVSGIAAIVLNAQSAQAELLEGKDTKAQLALLACARYLRDRLPVDPVGNLLNGQDRILARAAEDYLELEDSAVARKLILAKHPGEALVLGDFTCICNVEAGEQVVWQLEEKLRREVRGTNGVEEIYALFYPSTLENWSGVVIRVNGRKVELSLHEVEGRRRVRALTENELQELKDFTSRREVDDLGPEPWGDEDAGDRLRYEYLRLTKQGGRRIVLDKFARPPKNPTLHEELAGLFYKLSKSGEFKERYALEDKIQGLEVMLVDDKQQALGVCMEGSEVRVLVREKDSKFGHVGSSVLPEWRLFSSGFLGGAAEEPSACRVLDFTSIIKQQVIGMISLGLGTSSLSSGLGSTFSRSEDVVVFADSRSEEPGIWKYEPKSEPVKILGGSYLSPVITPDSKWLIALKIDNRQSIRKLIRYHTQTGQESTINIPQNGFQSPRAYVAAHRKILVSSDESYYTGGSSALNYLLDPETGIMQQVRGEFRPLHDQIARPLQPTGEPHEFWSAVYNYQKGLTTIGRYDSKAFVFKPLLELSGVKLSSADIWVDVATNKLWFTYRGHLLRLPLPR